MKKMCKPLDRGVDIQQNLNVVFGRGDVEGFVDTRWLVVKPQRIVREVAALLSEPCAC